jgi:two-component system, NarL family, response regulator
VAILNQQSDMRVVAEAKNGKEALEAFRQHRPDVTLMDLQMPEGDGLSAIRAIRRDAPNARILVLTTYEGDEDIYQAMKAGASAYVIKTAPGEQLLTTVRNVNNGATIIPPEVASQLVGRISSRPLTNREQEVLEGIAKGLSNQEIGNALFITDGTVKSHVNHILSKLNVSDRTLAALTAIKRGLVHLP